MEIGGYCTHHRPPPLARGLPAFEDFDADTSGGISLEEYADAAKTRRGDGRGPDPAKRFARIDGDEDGSITSDELNAFRARFQPATAGALLGTQETSPESKPPSLENRLADLFARLDTDSDGAINLAELVAAVKNLPGGNNDPAEDDGSDTAQAASDGVEVPATAPGAGDTAVEVPTEADAAPIAVDGAEGDGDGDGDADSPRDRWRARLEEWGDRFGDAWRDRFADRAERWHDRWADRLTDRADGAETRPDRIGDRIGDRFGDRWDARRAEGADDTSVAGALRELIALLREALGTDDAAGTDAAGTAGEATSSDGPTATGSTAATGATTAGATPDDTFALGDGAIDRLAALLAPRIEAYLKAGTQNAAAETTLSATA